MTPLAFFLIFSLFLFIFFLSSFCSVVTNVGSKYYFHLLIMVYILLFLMDVRIALVFLLPLHRKIVLTRLYTKFKKNHIFLLLYMQ